MNAGDGEADGSAAGARRGALGFARAPRATRSRPPSTGRARSIATRQRIWNAVSPSTGAAGRHGHAGEAEAAQGAGDGGRRRPHHAGPVRGDRRNIEHYRNRARRSRLTEVEPRSWARRSISGDAAELLDRAEHRSSRSRTAPTPDSSMCQLVPRILGDRGTGSGRSTSPASPRLTPGRDDRGSSRTVVIAGRPSMGKTSFA
jgi:hypothetical protein